MSTKRLARSTTDRMIAGVCGGIANYLNIDPTLVRLAFVLLVLVGGVSPLVYLILWAVMPAEDTIGQPWTQQVRENLSDMGQRAQAMAGQMSQHAHAMAEQMSQHAHAMAGKAREAGASQSTQEHEAHGPSTGPTTRL
ncbi:PspC domain-containing protein [Kallotenue papyrolyticum]|uniref:PspC domain-containing protein n=1 Tax=Kallotenue papyrolyticum TaxID=1325125 RepID=UPI0004786702|nr:PspC domain-containing protein [Kallotenue papyrolyticum]